MALYAPAQHHVLAYHYGGFDPGIMGLIYYAWALWLRGYPVQARAQSAKALSLAQQLVYGRGEHKANGIVLQLHRSEDLPAARARLTTLFRQMHLDLGVRDFGVLSPFYGQVKWMFSACAMKSEVMVR